MIMPPVEFDKTIVDRDSDALAAGRLPRLALPPRLRATAELLQEAIVAPRNDGVSELCRLKSDRV